MSDRKKKAPKKTAAKKAAAKKATGKPAAQLKQGGIFEGEEREGVPTPPLTRRYSQRVARPVEGQ